MFEAVVRVLNIEGSHKENTPNLVPGKEKNQFMSIILLQLTKDRPSFVTVMSKKGRFDKDALPINPRMYKKGTFGGRGGGGGERRGVSLFLSHTHLQKHFLSISLQRMKKMI